MNLCIIGAGNMGGAIALGAAKRFPNYKINVTNRSGKNTERFTQFPNISCYVNNKRATKGADVIILAVKPWVIKDVINEISDVITADQALVSVAGGISLSELEGMLPWTCPLFRVIPNIAASVGESMTFISERNAGKKVMSDIVGIFSALGKVSVIEERLLPAATAVCSCGIAYAFRYIRASVEGAIELGISPCDALDYITQTLVGAAAVINHDKIHPEEAIDRVTTPGGITIKGLNAMEANGFTNAVIAGLKASK